MKVEGKWKGYYEYGEGYFLPYFGERVEFEVDFYSADGVNIEGKIHEIPSKFSVKEDSILKGFIEEEVISFIKTYPTLPSIDQNSNEIFNDEGTLEVIYTGLIDEENNTLYGVWSIQEEYINDNGYNDVIYNAGIWLLKRQ